MALDSYNRALQVAIVGGGIGGLTLAGALTKRGIHVDLYEQAMKLGDVGAGVALAPNSVRLLNRIGLEDEIIQYGAKLGFDSSYFREDGTPVAPYTVTDSNGWHAAYGMHRADLLTMLANIVPAKSIHLGHHCIGFEQDERGARLFFDNGVVAEADIVIGCDGIRSISQGFVAERAQPTFSGSIAYRGLIPTKDVPFIDPELFLWMGQGKHFLTYPVRGGELINYVAFVPARTQKQESWSAPGDPLQLAKEFTGWDPRITQLIENIDSTFVWGLYDREPLDNWTRGRITLLGDAAHPMLPHMGQGANQSIEDAFALAVLLEGANATDPEPVLKTYEQIRQERTTRIQLGSRENGRRYDSTYKDLETRDQELKAQRDFRAWLYDYDAEKEAALINL